MLEQHLPVSNGYAMPTAPGHCAQTLASVMPLIPTYDHDMAYATSSQYTHAPTQSISSGSVSEKRPRTYAPEPGHNATNSRSHWGAPFGTPNVPAYASSLRQGRLDAPFPRPAAVSAAVALPTHTSTSPSSMSNPPKKDSILSLSGSSPRTDFALAGEEHKQKPRARAKRKSQDDDEQECSPGHGYSRTAIAKSKFSTEEDVLLVSLKETKHLTWKQIAKYFPRRTSGTLQVRYCTKLKAKPSEWSEDMVCRLKAALEEYDNERWTTIASQFGGDYSADSCRERAIGLNLLPTRINKMASDGHNSSQEDTMDREQHNGPSLEVREAS